MRIAIQGLGRMGRLFLRAAVDRGLDVVAVNEPKGTPETLALGVEFDSVQGRFPHPVHGSPGRLLVGDRSLMLRQEALPERLSWRDLGVDLVVECSGKVKQRGGLDVHLQNGARHVLVSNPVPGARNVVVGVNDAGIDFAREAVVTAASCTTNCLAPIVRVLHDAIGIARGLVTTVHDPTNTQGVVDRADADPRRGRSALLNLIPTTTNSATAVVEIVPELAGKLDSIAVRAPVLNASLTDCAFQMARPTDVDEVNRALRLASESGRLKGILGYETRPLVSSDFARDPRSAVVDALCTRVVDGTLVKVMAWYDNEWGYVNRMADLALRFATARR
jgi:glyceraldehyde 3-phosphate dehydrogenase